MMKNIQLALFCLWCPSVMAQNQPDLTLANLNITNPVVAQGQVLNYKFDLKNIGIANASGNFNVKAYFSQDAYLSTDDIQDGIVPTANFAAGFTAFQVAGASRVINAIAAGNYYLLLKADGDNNIAESNENNNIIASTPITVTPANSCRYQDSLQLVRLYNATNGAHWTNKWNLSAPMTTWYGVGLTPAGCVESLYLMSNNLVGTIPNLNMPELLAMALTSNQLNGAIPNFNLPKLQALGLASNQLTGTIPAFHLPDLIILHVENNQLTGTIPSFNLPKMRDLYLSNNQLTGSIPNFNMPLLEIMDFQSNQLNSTLPNFNLPKLQLLFLQNNRLTGAIPAFHLAGLRALYLNNNQLTGSIPTFNTPQLLFLQLQYNLLSGCLPTWLHSICGLVQNVNISNNIGLTNQNISTFCSANVGECVANLPDLTITNLNLTNNTVQQGQVLNYKFDLKNIGIANASGSFKVKAYISRDNILSYDDIQDGEVATGNFNAGFTSFQVAGASAMRSPIGAGPYYLILKADSDNFIVESNENNNIIASQRFQVTPLLSSCRYQDSLQLIHLYNATNGSAWTNPWNLSMPIHTWYGITLTAEGCVKNIELFNNHLVGTLPNLNLPKLDLLQLANNALSGSIPAFHLPLLQLLAVAQNQLTGSLPNFNLPNLKAINLQNNQLTGSIPNFNCPLMVFMDLSNNPFTGPIPNFNYPELTGIILNFTQVSGTLPNFNLPKLTLLHLNNNQLTGSIPNFNLPLVENLFLNSNRFTGNIPAFHLPKASPILLDNNQLTGSIPDFNVPANCFIRLNNNQLSGCIPISLKKFCNFGVEMTNNPGLANQDFATFCSANVGACTTTTANYCASKGNTPWNEWIAGVQFSNINNPNPKQGYGDFTGATANVSRNASYAFTLTQGYSWATDPSNATAQWRVWIDYNKNNVFDANELAASGTRTTSTASIAIPATASLGKTRMRVSFKKTGAPTACEVFENGEVEDYSVNIGSSAAIAGQATVVTNRLNAMLYEQKVKLDWVHTSDKAATFEIQKPTTDGLTFETIHRTEAKPAANYYMGYDEIPVEGNNDYRLKTVLKDGSIQYSPIQRIDYQKLTNFTIFPNPTLDEAFLDLKDFEKRKVNITISDVAGKVLLNQTIENASALPHRLDVSTLKNGAYSVQIQTTGKRSVTRQLYILN